MNTRKTLAAIAIVAFTMPLLNSCKKGEGDPFLSLRPRKSRVTGEWTIDSWKENSEYSSTSNNGGSVYTDSGNSMEEISGGTVTGNYSNNNDGPWGPSSSSGTYNGSGSATITFEKDGTFKRVIEYKNINVTTTSSGFSYNSSYNETHEYTGSWNFLGGVEEDFKDKERIILNLLEWKSTFSYSEPGGSTINGTETQSFTNGTFSEVWQITTLKNKEMAISATYSINGSRSSTEAWGGTTYIYSGSSSETGSINASLTQD